MIRPLLFITAPGIWLMTAVRTDPSLLTRQFCESFPKSLALYEQAKDIFPGGVTHDLRSLSPFPIYVNEAHGSHKADVDGHDLIDYWTGHGALLMGHSHPDVVRAVQEQMPLATHPGACHEREIEWGKWVQRLIPSAEKVRFVGSGTEATLMALRLARMHTGKPKVLKFAGHFHGWHDYVMIGVDHLENRSLPGAPEEVCQTTVVIPPNDPELLEKTLREDSSIGCVILEPSGGHWGQVPIRKPFLEAIREITQSLDRVLIFDEVITGFRVAPGGAQGQYGVTPDLTTLAKILAGGLPGGCCAGRAELMAYLEKREGHPKMPHPGTFNANPLSAAAGITVLEHVSTGKPTDRANTVAAQLRQKLNALFQKKAIPWVAYGEFSTWRLIPNYQGTPPNGESFIPYDGDFQKLNQYPSAELTYAFRCAMLLHGVDLPGLGGLTMAAHTDEDVSTTVEAVDRAMALLSDSGVLRGV